MPQSATALERDPLLRVLLMGYAKAGKAQPEDEPVLTPDGWRRMGDLHVGDLVIASDGQPTRVIGVFPQGRKKIVKMITSDGANALCCDDHLWQTAPMMDKGTIKTAREIRESIEAIHYLPRLGTSATRVVAVEDAGESACMCIEVDSIDSLYVTRDFLLTHNTTSTIVSLVNAVGPGYVGCCGDKSGMNPAKRRTTKFDWDLIRDENHIESYLKEGRLGVKEGRYKWLFLDDFSLYASFLEGAMRDLSIQQSKSGEPDGRRYWPEFKQRLLNVVRRLLDIRAHVILSSHYIESGPEIDGQRAKSGRGIMPMIGGSAREELPALFQDVIFMEKESEKGKEDRRVFRINPEGVWGPGCRNIDGTHTIDADFGAFMRLAADADKGRRR